MGPRAFCDYELHALQLDPRDAHHERIDVFSALVFQGLFQKAMESMGFIFNHGSDFI